MPKVLDWDLDADIGFGLRLSPNYDVKKHEELHICYGERANSYLLVEYGFTIPDNKYDFVRKKGITAETFGYSAER